MIKFMNKSSYVFLIISLILFGCGRHESGYIVNETGVPIIIELKMNEPINYIITDALSKNNSSDLKEDAIDNYFISFDSLSNIAILTLPIDEKLLLGTVRLDRTRDSIKYWEFSSILVKGKGVEIQASGGEMLKFIEKNKNWYSQASHYFVLK